jgi:uncharacterized protein (TIGR02118 family)
MAGVKLMILYPYPEDTAQFDRDYREHLELLHQKMSVPEDVRPYTVTRFLPMAEGHAPFYQLFSMSFPSAEALQQVMGSSEMQQIAADAVRISTGGMPVILVGSDVP